jgi:dolichyl-diphosphooligosaccharide--protein glycosyltransferase
MSWWDYGHLITYIAKRIPNANPFQRGVAGPTGAAAYFLLPSEDATNAILDTLGTKYVVTDVEMDTGKFYAMATWYNSSVGGQPYTDVYAMQSSQNPSQLVPVQGFTQNYYETMVSRLHNFDGSMTEPAQVYYIEYTETQINGVTYPVITSGIAMNFTAANAAVNAFNARAGTGTRAALFSTSVILPLGELPALKHYRLVHESPSNVLQDNVSDLKYVKVFEYVKGAHLKGTGIIEVPLVTNTGRTFTYRQASENGEFIVPYSTTGGSNAVKATGRYHIAGTNQYFDVPETAVIEGKSIS